jgi:hypothetical protein
MLLTWSVYAAASLALMLSGSLTGRQLASSYLNEGERHSAAVLKRPADPCPDDSPVSHADCMGKELAFVGEHLDAFVTSLRGVLATSSNKDAQSKLDILNKTDAAWRQYRVQVCNLSFNYFSGGQGLIVESSRADCELRLDRAYVQQLVPLLNFSRVEEVGAPSHH